MGELGVTESGERKGTHVTNEGYRWRLGDFSVGRWAGDLLLLSGITATDPATGQVPKGYEDLDPAVAERFATGHVSIDYREGPIIAQAWKVFDWMQRILEREGLTLRHVVRLGHYLTDRNDFPSYMRVRQAFFPEQPPPGTAVWVTELLPTPDVRLEVEATAARQIPVDIGHVADLR
jgi:2-iminobutanoate/2-iminopropanoate deaminase